MDDAFALTAAALDGEPWRLWTGHFVHFDARHAAWNAIACAPVVAVLRRRVWMVLLWSVFAAPLISLVLLWRTPVIEYRGASALVIGAWVMAACIAMRERATRVVGALLLLLVAVKLMFSITTDVAVPPSPLAHWCGAILGAIVIFAVRNENRATLPDRSLRDE